MKPYISSILLAAMLPSIPLAATAAEPQVGTGETDGYHLIWQDLFDGDELNDLRWNIEVNGAGGGNNELQYYTDRPENVRLGDDGEGNHCLILTARREEYKGKHFTSGRVNSKNLITFQHGKVEAAVKLPNTANGLWPAFWMMGNDYDQIGWPRCGETDIFEFGHGDGIRNNTQDRYFNGAMHWGPQWPNASYAKHNTRGYSLQDGEYHVYTCFWDENEVRMYVDYDKNKMQNPYFRMTCPCDEPDNEWSPGNYFHKLNFILFNLAVGGNFPGIFDADGITALNDDNGHQASMYVNYVKIYQKGGVGEDSFFADPGDELSGIEDILADKALTDIIVGNDTISLPSKGRIELYDIAGRCISAVDGESLDLDGIASGCFIVKAGIDGCLPSTLKIRR